MARTDYFKFLDALAANNDRAWFQAHRAEYEAIRDQWLEDLQKLIAHTAYTETCASAPTNRRTNDT